MDFNKIFDTYTKNLDPKKRSDTISQAKEIAGNIGYAIQNLLSPNSPKKNNNLNPETDSSENSIFSALSELDHIDDEIIPDIDSENTDSEINIDNIEEGEEEFAPPISDDDEEADIIFEEDSPKEILPSPAEEVPSPLESSDSESELGDIGLEDFMADLDPVEPLENDDLMNLPLNEEVGTFSSEIAANDDFEIEHPEEDSEDELDLDDDSSDSVEISPFDTISLEDDVNEDITITNTENLPPTEYENMDESFQFNSWEDKESDLTSMELSDEQIFLVRDKINSIKNKELRLSLRNIILEPKKHASMFDQLVSLLIVNSSEELILDFINKNSPLSLIQLDDQENEDETPIRSTFFADDVATYQENLYNMQVDIINTLKSVAFYGVIGILSLVISWVGVIHPLQVDNLFKKGFVALQENEFEKSESFYQQAVSSSGKPLEKWSIQYADAYTQKNMIRLAEEKYKEALAFDPSFVDVANAASKFYTNLGLDYYPEAVSIMDNLSLYHKKRFDVWDELGKLYVDYAEKTKNDSKTQESLYYKGLDVYLGFIKNNPKKIAPYYKIAEIYITLGNKEQVEKIRVLLEQSKFKILNIELWTKLVKYYIDHRDLDIAGRLLKKMHPFLDEYGNNIPRIQKLMKKHFNTDPNKILDILAELYYQYARFKILSSDNSGAEFLLSNSIKLNENNAKAYNLLGESFLISPSRENRLSEAKELFEKSLEIDPTAFKPHVNIGHIYYYWDADLGNSEYALTQALYHYKMALTLSPTTYKNYLLSYNLGWLDYKNENIDEAIDDWSYIYKENPNDPILSYALGCALFKKGNPKLAQTEFAKSITYLENLKKRIPVPTLTNKRHREIFNQLIRLHNNMGVIHANYAKANPKRENYFETQALLHFYTAKDIADQLNKIHSLVEYNLGVITRPKILNRKTEFDDDIPKDTTLENIQTELTNILLEDI